MDLDIKEPRVIQIEDDEDVIGLFRKWFARHGIPLIQAGSKSEFFKLPRLEANLYLLDRHFPALPGSDPNDTSWREVAQALDNIYPGKPIILATGQPPKEGDWRQYRNIIEVVKKPIADFPEFMQKVRGYLNNGE